MEEKISKTGLKKLLNTGEIEKVIEILVEETIGIDKLQNLIILINSSYKDLKEKEIAGVLSPNEQGVRKTQLLGQLLDLIDTFFKQKPKPQDKQKKAVTQGQKVWFLFEDGPGFTTTLRNKLYPSLNKLGFEVMDFFRERKAFRSTYENALDYYDVGLQEFFVDKNSKWILTVYPEEERNESMKISGQRKILRELKSRNKYMICFESGDGFKKILRDPYYYLKIIESTHENSMRNMIRHLVSYLEQEQRIHLVIMPGPKMNPIANRRLQIIFDFVVGMLNEQLNRAVSLTQGSLEYQQIHISIKNYKPNLKSIHISTPDFNSWDRFKSKNAIESIVSSLNIADKNVHTSFLCVNDDVALGVLDALKDYKKRKNIDYVNISIFGFDGIEEMIEVLDDNTNDIRGGTMKVDFDLFCGKAVKLIEQNVEFDPELNFTFPAIPYFR